MNTVEQLPLNAKRFSRLCRCIAALCLLTITVTGAKTYYVAPTGSNSASGTIDQPYATMQKANDVAVAGDTFYFRAGTYSITTPSNSNAGITITKSGSSDTKRICFWAYKGEIPVFNFSKMTILTGAYTHGIVVTGSWLHFKGLEICNVPMTNRSNCGMHVDNCGNNIFELMNFHHNNGAGVFTDNTSGGQGGHLFLNCDSHENYDPGSHQGDGQNADGFGIHYQKSGSTSVLRGCRAWWNSDDGFDCINQSMAVLVENCWFWLNGYKPGTLNTTEYCNGNGCKLGGYGLPPAGYPSTLPVSTVKNCIAFLNKATGFDHNFHPGNNFYYNNTAFNNDTNFLMVGYNISAGKEAGMGTYKNNIAFGGGLATGKGTGATASYNSWDITGLTLAASDFLSVDTTGVYGPRKADGSLPDVTFMHLASGSKCIDKGTNVGLTYVGTAPDLGAYEYGGQTGIQVQRLFYETMPVSMSSGRNDLQKIRLFDLAGRRVDNKMKDRAFQPIISRTEQQHSIRTFSIIE